MLGEVPAKNFMQFNYLVKVWRIFLGVKASQTEIMNVLLVEMPSKKLIIEWKFEEFS